MFVDSGDRWHKGYSDDQFPFNIYWRDGGAVTNADGTVSHAAMNNPLCDVRYSPDMHTANGPVKFKLVPGFFPPLYSYNSVRSFIPGDVHSGRHYIGKCDVECKYCHALMWPKENPSRCCKFGQVKVPPISHPFPPRLRELFTCVLEDSEADDASSGLLRQLRKDHKLFMSEWRIINSNLAFASFNAKMITMSKGPPLFKVQGQISCLVTSPCVRPAKNGAQAIDPLFCQLYFVDTAAAKESLQGNSTCKDSPGLYLLNELHELLRAPDVHNSRGILAPVNAIAELIYSMKELQDQYAAAGGGEIPLMTINFNKGKNINQKTHNSPSAVNDIGAVIVGSIAGQRTGLSIRNKATDSWSTLRGDNRVADAMVYVLFFPRADSSWERGMKYVQSPQPASPDVMMQIELDGLLADAMATRVDGKSMPSFTRAGHDDGSSTSSSFTDMGSPGHRLLLSSMTMRRAMAPRMIMRMSWLRRGCGTWMTPGITIRFRTLCMTLLRVKHRLPGNRFN